MNRTWYKCKKCDRIIQKYRSPIPIDQICSLCEYRIDKRHKLALSEYKSLLEQQNYRCAICNKHQDESSKRLAIDHCHKINQIRGLLCDNCNRGIGYLKDSINILQNAINYLERNEENTKCQTQLELGLILD